MSARLVNTAILVLLVLALASGTGSFLVATASWSWVVWLHSIAGFTLIALLAWKWRIIANSFRRRGAGVWAAMPVVLSVLVLGVLVTGVLWATTGLPGVPMPGFGRVSGLTFHVVLALATVPLLVLHVILRWPRPRRADFAGRRAVLRQLGLVGAGTAGWLAVESATRVLALPGADRRFTGSREDGSFEGNAHPVTNWLTDTRQHIDAASWRLRLAGLDGEAREISYEELLRAEVEVEEALLDCTGGWYTVQRWRGVPLATLLAPLDGGRGASSIVVRGATGYERRFDISKAGRLLLATHVEDEPLSASHGFPARLVAPGYRGFHWVKWVTEIRLSERAAWWQPPFPLQ